MKALEGAKVRLRALEPSDVGLMYAWENDLEIWQVSGTLAPFSRHTLERFLEEQRLDIFRTNQQRLIIERLSDNKALGAIDLYEFTPVSRRAGVGILIHAIEDRGKGYASDALGIICTYAREVLQMHQLWGSVTAENLPCIALFERHGFVRAGVRREWQWHTDGYHDEVVLQRILE